MKNKAASRAGKKSPGKPSLGPAGGGYSLRLFVAGATTLSREVVLRVRQRCAAEFPAGGRLEVIDIYQQPALARVHNIIATPTLIIDFPRPVRRLIGSLSNTAGLFNKPGVIPQASVPL